MSNQNIRDLLAKLHSELQNTTLDETTRESLTALDSEISQLLEPSGTADSDSAIARARKLETNFAANHPAAERFVREIVDALARMGV